MNARRTSLVLAGIYALLVPAVSLGLGCVLTNYQLITDNDQVANGSGTGVVDTHGKAHAPGYNLTYLWPDGTDELLWFVDQRANGDRTLTTYNNFSTAGEPSYHDDLYCNTDWQGCAITTAHDPQVGDVDPYDYVLNPHCEGARSLSMATGMTRYYGECGRARMPLQDRIALLNMGRIGTVLGVEGLFYSLDATNLTISVDNNAGVTRTLPVSGTIEAFAPRGGLRSIALDLTHPLLASTGRAYADFLANDATRSTTVTLRYHGIAISQDLAGAVGLSSPDRVLANMNRHY